MTIQFTINGNTGASCSICSLYEHICTGSRRNSITSIYQLQIGWIDKLNAHVIVPYHYLFITTVVCLINTNTWFNTYL